MTKTLVTIEQIRELLPHRYPMLLVDRVLELKEGEIIAEKFVTANEPYFQGHFPEKPVMPGILIIEALAQAAGIGLRLHSPELRRLAPVLASVRRARFRKPVLPGSVLTLHAQYRRARGNLFSTEAVARVLGETVAEAQMMAAMVEWEDL